MPIFSSIGKLVLFPIRFIGEVAAELKHVSWPTRKQTMESTLLVITLSLFVGVCIGGLDFVFTKVLGLVIK